MIVQRANIPLIALMLFLLGLMGCETLQTLGREHRENLTFHVEKAQTEQEEAKQQFQTTYQEFKSLVNYDGGDWETKYYQLQDQYEECEDRAEDVGDRIQKIELVAGKLFMEWEQELAQYHSRQLRESSEDMLVKTKQKYRNFLLSMKRAEAKMKPVLLVFADQVLFLKHNLNANAVASLQTTVIELRDDVSDLVEDLETSIADAKQFIQSMQNAS